LDVPIVPVSIKGMGKAWPKELRYPKRNQKIILNIGKPIKPTGNYPLDSQFLRNYTDLLYQQS